MTHSEMVTAILKTTEWSQVRLATEVGDGCTQQIISRLLPKAKNQRQNSKNYGDRIVALYQEHCQTEGDAQEDEGPGQEVSIMAPAGPPITTTIDSACTLKAASTVDGNEQEGAQAASSAEEDTTQDPPSEPKEEDLEQTLRTQVYSALIQVMHQGPDRGLNPTHYAKLQRERGFTPATIQSLGIVSASQTYLQPAVEALYDQGVTAEELHTAGLLEASSPSSPLNSVLLEDDDHPYGRLLIPYMHNDGRVYHLRPHKLGFKGIPIQVFGLNVLEQGAETIVITEGELKAAALWQCEIASIAVPGISSFAGRRFPELLELLLQFEVKNVVVLFDNEAKDDPSLPNYKEDPQRRYDTDYFAVRLAQQLYGPTWGRMQSALIARLPNEWRVEGKVDPDLALSQGRTAKELKAVVEGAVTPDKYLRQLSKEGKLVVGCKLAKDEEKFSKLRASRQGYTWPVQRGKETVSVSVSNFTIAPLMTRHRADKTRVRVYEASNNRGEVVKIQLEPKDLRDPKAFRLAMMQAGNFEWMGNGDSFYALTRRLTAQMPPNEVQEQDTFGRQDDGTWLFKGGMVQEGQIILPSEDGVIWNGLKGVTPLTDGGAIPDLPLAVQKDDLSLLELGQVLAENLGTPAVWLALGWAMAVAFADTFFKKYKFFPLLGLFGRKGSGKTVLARHLVSMWGLSDGLPLIWHSSTTKGLDRTVARMRSLPVWIDEYRNNASHRMKSALRGYFDRGSGVMAVYTNSLETRTIQPKGSIILSGEELPDDPALVDRLVALELDYSVRRSDLYKRIKELFTQAHQIILRILLHQEGMEQEMLAASEDIMQRLQHSLGAQARGDRMVQTHAIPVAALLVYLERFETGWEEPMEGFMEWLWTELPRLYELRSEADHLERFWRQLGVLAMESAKGQNPAINRDHLVLSRDGKTLWVYLDGVYKEFARSVRSQSGEAPFSQDTIRQYLQAASYFTKTASRKLAEGHSRRCQGINLYHPECPPAARELAQSVFNWSAIPGQDFDGFEGYEEMEA